MELSVSVELEMVLSYLMMDECSFHLKLFQCLVLHFLQVLLLSFWVISHCTGNCTCVKNLTF